MCIRVHRAILSRLLHCVTFAGPLVGYSKLQRIVDITNAIQPPPDIVVITGDLLDGPYEHLKDATIPLERFNRPAYYITGVSRRSVHFSLNNSSLLSIIMRHDRTE